MNETGPATEAIPPEEVHLPGEIIIDVCFNIRAFVDEIGLQTQLIRQMAGSLAETIRFYPPGRESAPPVALAQMCSHIMQTAQKILYFEAIADVYAFTKLSAANDPEWMRGKLDARGVTTADFSRWLAHPPRALLLAIMAEIRPLLQVMRQYAQTLHDTPPAETVLVNNVRPVTLRELAEELLRLIHKSADYLQDVQEFAEKRLK
jgi:hypothetical protein